MPKFYFHTDDHQDGDGTDLASLSTAKCEAVKLAAGIICDDADRFWDDASWNMTVTDGTGLTLFQLHMVGVDAPTIQKVARA